MDFVTAIRLLSPSERAQVNHILQMWERRAGWEGEILVSNLRNEQFLELTAWQVLFDEIISTYGRILPSNAREWTRYRDSVQAKCIGRLWLQGGAVCCKPPVRVGIALPRNRFENYLLEHCPQWFRGDEAFDSFYLNCRRQEGAIQLPKTVQKALVAEANRLLWVTWDDKSGGQRPPFLFALHDGDEHPEKVRTGLGMGNLAYRDKGLVTLVFDQSALSQLFKNTDLQRPTFADANMCICFFPGRDEHGITNPLQGGQVVIDDIPYTVKHRPEAIQKSENYKLSLLLNLTKHDC